MSFIYVPPPPPHIDIHVSLAYLLQGHAAHRILAYGLHERLSARTRACKRHATPRACKLCARTQGMQGPCHGAGYARDMPMCGRGPVAEVPEIGWPGTPFWGRTCGHANACPPPLPELSRARDVCPGSPPHRNARNRIPGGVEGRRERNYRIYFP